MAEQQFCLRWNNFQANIVSSFESLLDGEEFVDVTLTAEGKSVKAHRVLLSACSPYFRDLFRDLPPHQHPVIVLRDTSFLELKSLLSFIYHGEVNVSQERLGLLLKTAEALRIKGLAQDKKSKDQFGSIGSSPEKEQPDESLDKTERERRCGPSSPSLPLSFSGVPVSGMPPSNPLTSLEPPSHKPIGTAAHTIMPSPPSKRRKHLHSPHSAPPPSLVALREPPPPTTSSSSSSSSTALHEEDNAPVGMNLSTTGGTPNTGPLSPRMVPKVEVMEEEGSGSVGRGSGNGGHGGVGDVSDNEADEARSHDGELGELDTSTTSSSDLHGLPPHLSAAVQNFVPYVAAAAAGSSQLDTFPGPSGVLPQASQAGWRGGHPESSDTSAQGGHPVFNELLCGDGGYGGKKAVPTPCPVCSKVLSNAYNMRVHLETHQDITYKCIICGIITRTRDTMRKHLSNVHKLRNVELKNSFKKLTGKSSSNSTSLATTTTTTSPPATTSTTPSKMSSPALSVRSKKVSSPPSGGKAAVKAEPGVDMTPSSMEAMEAIEAINLAKGNNLASIVSKLSQKQ